MRRVKSEVFTMNMCERIFEEMHADCPGWMKYDPELMESAKATQKDTVFCICPCRKRARMQLQMEAPRNCIRGFTYSPAMQLWLELAN